MNMQTARAVVTCGLLLCAFSVPAQGLLDGLKDNFGEKTPVPERAPDVPPEQAATMEAFPPIPPIVRPAPDLERLEARIETLKRISPTEIEPIDSLAEARKRVEILQQRANDIERRNKERTELEYTNLASQSERLRQRWTPLARAITDGGGLTAELLERLLDATEEPGETVENTAAAMRREADQVVGDPTFIDQLGREQTAPVSPDQSSQAGEPAIKSPDLSGLERIIKESDIPEGISPLEWAKLQDRFEREIAAMFANSSAAMRQLQLEQDHQMEWVAPALDAAKRQLAKLERHGKKPSVKLRREMAWRLHQARLAQLIELRDTLKRLAEIQTNQTTMAHTPLIRLKPFDPEPLMDLARAMDLAGAPGAPEEGAFDRLEPGDLQSLYPGGAENLLDDQLRHYRRLVQANIERLRRKLRLLRSHQANAEEMLREEDRQKLKNMWYGELDSLYRRGVRFDKREKERSKSMVIDYHNALEDTLPMRLIQRQQQLQKEIDTTMTRLAEQHARMASIKKAASEALDD